jgi:hypothetical protein
MDRDWKALELAAQQINAIQNRRGEAMKMAEYMPKRAELPRTLASIGKISGVQHVL